ncbi:MAG TPA: hypothetical protein PKE00_00010 [Planctomycetota bacterium]|nr:hypothetical protein [Planctomycetota bacterium]
MDDEKKEELLCALLRMSQIRAEASVIRARRLIADFAPSLKGDDLATIRLAIAIATRPANETEAKTEPQQGVCIPGELLDWLTGPGGRELVMSIDADNEVCIQLLEQEVVDGMRLKAFGLTWQFGLNSAVDLLRMREERA